MAQHRIKRTDQEWLDLINLCRTSGMKVKTWCEQYGITVKALYYHTRQLRQKGYAIPYKQAAAISQEKQEVVCLDISDPKFSGLSARPCPGMEGDNEPALRIDFRGIHIGVSNHAAQDTIIHTFQALRELC